MKRQREKVEFFPVSSTVPRRTQTPIFEGAHVASKNASGNRAQTVPGSSQTQKDIYFYSGPSGSRSGTVPSGGTAVPTPKGWSGNRDPKGGFDPMSLGTGTACDGCGLEARIAIVTDFGSRLCRRCLRGE